MTNNESQPLNNIACGDPVEGSQVHPESAWPSISPRDEQADERARWEKWAEEEARVAYRSEKHGLVFYDTGTKTASWVAWQARAAITQQAAPDLASRVRALAEKWSKDAIADGFAGSEPANELFDVLDANQQAAPEAPTLTLQAIDARDAARYRVLRAGNDYERDGAPMVLLYEKASDQGDRPFWSISGEVLDSAADALILASPAATTASASGEPDRAAFEAQARYQGATDFEPAGVGMVCENGWFPATYRDPMTELAWRVWANKSGRAPAPSREAPQAAAEIPAHPGIKKWQERLKESNLPRGYDTHFAMEAEIADLRAALVASEAKGYDAFKLAVMWQECAKKAESAAALAQQSAALVPPVARQPQAAPIYQVHQIDFASVWCDVSKAEYERCLTEKRVVYAAPVAQGGEQSAQVPAEVRAALDRMCLPLHESRLSGVTAQEDARCMQVIKQYIEGAAHSSTEVSAHPAPADTTSAEGEQARRENIASQCRATASNDIAHDLMVDAGKATLRDLLLDAADALTGAQAAPQGWTTKLFNFIDSVVEVAFEGGDLDGGEIQEWAETAGLLEARTMAAPCSEGQNCRCADGNDFPLTCYQKTYRRAVAPAQAAPADLRDVAIVEQKAKEIYAQFPFADKHPWIEGGNSLRQDDARAIARAVLCTTSTPTEGAAS